LFPIGVAAGLGFGAGALTFGGPGGTDGQGLTTAALVVVGTSAGRAIINNPGFGAVLEQVGGHIIQNPANVEVAVEVARRVSSDPAVQSAAENVIGNAVKDK